MSLLVSRGMNTTGLGRASAEAAQNSRRRKRSVHAYHGKRRVEEAGLNCIGYTVAELRDGCSRPGAVKPLNSELARFGCVVPGLRLS